MWRVIRSPTPGSNGRVYSSARTKTKWSRPLPCPSLQPMTTGLQTIFPIVAQGHSFESHSNESSPLPAATLLRCCHLAREVVNAAHLWRALPHAWDACLTLFQE